MGKAKAKAPLGLEEKLAAIGIMVSTRPLTESEIDSVDIEDTLVEASIAFSKDVENLSRWLGPVLTWVQVHGSAVIVEKLCKILDRRASKEPVEYIALFARLAMVHGHKRWRIVFSFRPKTPKLVGPSELAASLVKLRGEEPWALEVGFLVPRGSLSIEEKWVLSRSGLARLNQQYRNRLVYGAQWRADIITAIERGARTSSEVSRASGASYEPCHRVLSELTAAGIASPGRKIS